MGRICPILSLPFFNLEEALPDKIPEGSSYGAFGHLQLSRHGGNRRPAHTFLVGPAPQVQINGNSSAGQLALVQFLKVCHLPSPFLVPFFSGWAHWRGLWCPAVWAVLSALPPGFLPWEAAPAWAAGTFPGWLSPRCSFQRMPQAGFLCPELCTALRRRSPTGRTASVSPSWDAPRFS